MDEFRFAEYPVEVVAPRVQQVRCVEQANGVVVYEFRAADGDSITRVKADDYDDALREVRSQADHRARAPKRRHERHRRS